VQIANQNNTKTSEDICNSQCQDVTWSISLNTLKHFFEHITERKDPLPIARQFYMQQQWAAGEEVIEGLLKIPIYSLQCTVENLLSLASKYILP
jgi:hypothetical protein